MAVAGRREAYSFLAFATALVTAAAPCAAAVASSVACFYSSAPSLSLPPSQTARALPSATRCSRPGATNRSMSIPLERNYGWRRRPLVAAMAPQSGADDKRDAAEKGDNGNGGKRRFFGLVGGNSDDSNNNSKAVRKKQRRRGRESRDKDESDSLSTGGFFRRKKKKDEEEQPGGKNGAKRGISVDINTFVGPVIPTDSEVSLRAMLDSSPEEEKRRAEAKRASEEAERRKRKAQERKDAKIKVAAKKSKKEADRRRAEQKKAEDRKRSEQQKKEGGILSGAQSFVSGVVGSVFNEKEKEEWIVVCPKTRISPGEVVPVVAGGLDLLLVASRDGKRLACIANSCPHLGTPLETGIVERRPVEGPASRKPDIAEDRCEDCIVCPTHQTAFALASGEVRGEWCPYPPVLGKMMGAVKTEANLPTFLVRARGKNIEVRINSNLEDIKKS